MKKTFRVKTFMNGGSQAIRIPAIARFEGDEVELTYDTETELVTIKDIPPKSALTKLVESWAELPYNDDPAFDEWLAFIEESRERVSAKEFIKRLDERLK